MKQNMAEIHIRECDTQNISLIYVNAGVSQISLIESLTLKLRYPHPHSPHIPSNHAAPAMIKVSPQLEAEQLSYSLSWEYRRSLLLVFGAAKIDTTCVRV